MNKTNTEKLIKTFPYLYSDSFVFQCDDGWFNLLFGLSTAIGICKDIHQNVPEYVNYSIFQVKEKFGTLRYCPNSNLDPLSTHIITIYENYSSRICELCGSTNATLRNFRWIRTLCDNCKEFF